MVDRDESGSDASAAWIRSAFWVGRPHDEAQFHTAIEDDLVPALRTLPGVTDANALWPRKLEDQPPAIYCQILVFFPSREAVDRMLASPERMQLRGRVGALKEMFDGTLSHIDYEVA